MRPPPAIQMAKLAGCAQIVTTACPRHTATLHALGATCVLDRTLPSAAIFRELAELGVPVEFVFDAISERAMQVLGYEALVPGGVMLLVLADEIPADKKADSEGKRVVSVYGVVHAPENEAFGRELFGCVEGWLRSGVLMVRRRSFPGDGRWLIDCACTRTRSRCCPEAWRGWRRGWRG